MRLIKAYKIYRNNFTGEVYYSLDEVKSVRIQNDVNNEGETDIVLDIKGESAIVRLKQTDKADEIDNMKGDDKDIAIKRAILDAIVTIA